MLLQYSVGRNAKILHRSVYLSLLGTLVSRRYACVYDFNGSLVYLSTVRYPCRVRIVGLSGRLLASFVVKCRTQTSTYLVTARLFVSA